MSTMTAAPTAKRYRFDTLPEGSHVTLRFHTWGGEKYDEPAIFLGVTGEGEERRATFVQHVARRQEDGSVKHETYSWEAYRYSGGWAYGSSAHRLGLAGVLALGEGS